MGHYIIQSLDQTRGQLNVDIVSLNDGVNPLTGSALDVNSPNSPTGRGSQLFTFDSPSGGYCTIQPPGGLLCIAIVTSPTAPPQLQLQTSGTGITLWKAESQSANAQNPRYCYLLSMPPSPSSIAISPPAGPGSLLVPVDRKAEDRQLWVIVPQDMTFSPTLSLSVSGESLTVTGTGWVAGGLVKVEIAGAYSTDHSKQRLPLPATDGKPPPGFYRVDLAGNLKCDFGFPVGHTTPPNEQWLVVDDDTGVKLDNSYTYDASNGTYLLTNSVLSGSLTPSA